MKIHELHEKEPFLPALLEVWEASVRATHRFLSEEEIMAIKKYVPQAISSVEHLVAAEIDEKIIGFMGTQNRRLEMLFLTPSEIGKGIGKKLIRYGMDNYGINEVTVNEQNPEAVGFYRHMGFETYKRMDCDEEGNPYPLLYMKAFM